MTIISPLPNTFINGTIGDAPQVDANFDQVVANTNANAAHNGANSDITQLTGLTTPLTELQGGTGGTAMPAQGGSMALLATGTVGGGVVAFTGWVNARYVIYEIHFTNLVAGTNGSLLGLQLSEDGGSTYKGGTGYTYANTLNLVGTGVAAANSNGTDRFHIGEITVSSGGAATVSGKIRLYDPAVGQQHNFGWESQGTSSGGVAADARGGGAFTADSNAYNAVRLLMSAGNITSVKAYLYGLRIS